MAYQISVSMDEIKAGLAVLSAPETKECFSKISFESVKNNFLDVVKNRYFCFEGTASRAEFWQYYLAFFVLSIIPFLNFIAIPALLIPFWGTWARRLHEVGKSGWMIIIPVLNVCALILCLCKPAEGCGCGCGCEQK